MEEEQIITKDVLLALKTYQEQLENVDLSEGLALAIFLKCFESKTLQKHPLTTDDEIKSLLESNTNQSEKIPFTDDDVWVFGYGSLVWKADFPFVDRRHGFITSYQRRFFQNSIDHRGTSNKPGRVVTLVPTNDSKDRVYGTAYRIAAKHKDDVQRHLDHREKNGYERCVLPFYEFPESSGNSFDVVMYIATAENESYAGHLSDITVIADQIFTSAGPSGCNRDYLFHLAKAMRILFPGVEDKHLYELEEAVMKRVASVEPLVIRDALKKRIEHILRQSFDKLHEEQCDLDGIAGEIAKEIGRLRALCEEPHWREVLLAEQYFNTGRVDWKLLCKD